MSISDGELMNCKNGTVVSGVGGNQAVGKDISCRINLLCDPENTYTHCIKPAKIPGEPALVLLGVDFLSKFKRTTFDWKNSRLQLGDNWVYFVSDKHATKSSQHNISRDISKAQSEELRGLIEEAESLFIKNPKAPHIANVEPHVIETKNDRPNKDKFRPTPVKWRHSVEEQIKEMEQNGIIRESKSPYSSNLLLVDKKDGSKRFCVDYRTLNQNTVKDTYDLPNVADILDRIHGCKFFTQLDLASGYWGVPMSPRDIAKSAFTSHMGKWEFLRMPFGMCNSQATFQRAMDKLVRMVRTKGHDGVEAYVDNLLVFSKTYEEHVATLRELFKVLMEANISLRMDKCEFAKTEMEFLGFIINGSTVRPTPENVNKVSQFPVPKTRKQLQRFLGVVNFNLKFIEDYATVAKPLRELTSSRVKWHWTEEHQQAFEKVKKCLKNAPSLHLADFNEPFHIETDASNTAVGGVLFQMDEKKGRLTLAYFSKPLGKTEQGWTVTEKEMWAIIAASRKWRNYCAEEVIFYTDHLPLKYIRKQKDPRGKIARWIMELENLNYKVQYIPGKQNYEADYLSRITTDSNDAKEDDIDELPEAVYFVNSLPSLQVIAEGQRKDCHIADAMEQLSQENAVKKGSYRDYRNLTLMDGVLFKAGRILVPKSLTQDVIREYHGQYHSGSENTILMLSERFYWRGMKREIQEFVASCRTCSQCKDAKKARSKMQIPEPVTCRARLQIDIACMPLSNKGNAYFLQMIDADTKFAATIALPDQKAQRIKDACWSKWFPYFAIPEELLSDQGPNVDGKIIRDLCKKLGIKKMHSSPYHPEGNGSTERSIGSVKSILRAMIQSRGTSVHDWDILLNEATLAYNTRINKSTGFSPFKSMFGIEGVLPIDRVTDIIPKREQVDPELVRRNAALNKKDSQKSYKEKRDEKANAEKFVVGEKVLLKRKFGKYPKMNVRWKTDHDGEPYTIARTVGPVNYAIVNYQGVEKVYNREMLCKAGTSREASFIAIGAEEEDSNNTARVTTVEVKTKEPLNNSSEPELRAEPPAPTIPTLSTNTKVIDNEAFTHNVFRRTPEEPEEEHQNRRSKRVSKPVIGTRLIDQHL